MRRSNWLLAIVVLSMLACGGALVNKAQLEPWQRQIGLAVAYGEIPETSWWPLLQDAGVHFALITEPSQASQLPEGVQPVVVVTPDSWPSWREQTTMPAAIIFADNQFTDVMAAEARASAVPIGLLEFRPPTNFAADINSWGGQLLRVYDQPAHPFISEFTIAARERQVDLVVVRLALDADRPLGLEHVQTISEDLQRDGHVLTTSLQPRAELVTPIWVLGAVVLALGCLFVWMLSLVLPLSWRRYLLALPLVAGAGTWVVWRWLGPWQTRQLIALGAAVLYPSAGIFWWWAKAKGEDQYPAPVRGALLDFAVITGFALLGGLSVHATLADFAWHLNILQFWGVKAAYALPLALALVLVGLYWLWHGWSTGLRLRHRFLRYLILAVALLIFLAAVYILLNRTGNQSRVRILPIELEFREWLYRTLRVRPRTKEFLGYPILLAGLYLWRRNIRWLGGLAVLLGYIAELSLVNTFEHLHHPIWLSLLRSGLGLAIGLTLGLVTLAVVHLLLPATKEAYR